MSEDVTRRTGTAQLMSRIQALIGPALRDAEKVFHDELASPHPFIQEVLSHLTTYRGKRLRPMLLLLAGSAAGELKHAHSVLAAVVEMIHTATLVHDDVLDEATTRRHVATVNSRWNNETSVLLGDYLFTHAFHLTSTLGNAEACRLIGRATNVVCAGEMSQIAERGNLDLTEERDLEIIESKTAELCAVSTFLGAQWSGASSAVCEALDSYGRSLGIAFQIADDILDVMGAEQTAGKSLGSDLEKQKLTLPLIYLLTQIRGADADEVRDLLSEPDRQTRLRLAPLIERSGALEYARQRAIAYVLAARQQLSILPESPARLLLEDIADRVVDRDA
jgi:octaprenyl-diphosphate synthase